MTHPHQIPARKSIGITKLLECLKHDGTIYVVHRDSYTADKAHCVTVYASRRDGYQDFTGACAEVTGWHWNHKSGHLRCPGETLDDACEMLAHVLDCEWCFLVPEVIP